jgi:hypothetical protein
LDGGETPPHDDPELVCPVKMEDNDDRASPDKKQDKKKWTVNNGSDQNLRGCDVLGG